MSGHRLYARLVKASAIVVALSLIGATTAFAARSPFGIATPDTTGPAFTGPLGGFFAWVALYQSEFYRSLTHALGGIKQSGHAFILLAGVSFLYGVFHAVGPGHGKAVISSYLLVSRQTVRRGVVIAFAASLMQGVVAIAVVLIAAVILHVTAVEMTRATDWFEILSYALIAAVGAWLLWSKTFGGGHDHHHAIIPTPALALAHPGGPAGAELPRHANQLHGTDSGPPMHDHAHHHEHHHHHELAHDGHGHAHSAPLATARHRGHDHDHAGHSHAPDPRLLSRPLTVSRAWAAILAVGIRPCSGAIIILVFALSQHLLLAGVGSVLMMSLGTFITVSALAVLTVSAKDVALRLAGFDTDTAERVMRVVEITGALLVLLLGLTLLGGALQGGLPK
jgi:ABC-type nickel/cobalt efflux system permease component RcnA